MAPWDKFVGNYPKAKKPAKETIHYEIKNVGLYKDKKGKVKSIW